MTKAIIAKRFNTVGSKALLIDKIQPALETFKFLSSESKHSSVQIVAVNGLEGYREYYPIEEYTDSKRFTEDVLRMIKQ